MPRSSPEALESESHPRFTPGPLTVSGPVKQESGGGGGAWACEAFRGVHRTPYLGGFRTAWDRDASWLGSRCCLGAGFATPLLEFLILPSDHTHDGPFVLVLIVAGLYTTDM